MSADVRIVIGQRGFVWVGDWSQDGDEVVLRRAFNIRRAGTTRGFGELVTGPNKQTTLDPCGTIRMHRLSVVASYDCNAEKWEAALARK